MHKRNLLGISFISWMVAVTVLSLVSFDDDTSFDIEIPYFDKFVHFTFYFVGGALGMLYFRVLNPHFIKKPSRCFILWVSLVVYGIIIEVLQGSLTTYRSAELMDILANSVGAFLGIGLIWAVFSGKSRPKWKN